MTQIAARGEIARQIQAVPAIPEQRPAEFPQSFTLTLRNGAEVTLPEIKGCRGDHSHDRFVEDVTHVLGEVDWLTLPVDTCHEPDDVAILQAGVYLNPYSSDERHRSPYALVEIAEGEYTQPLGPEELAKVIAKVRAQADKFERLHARLVAATSEWVTE